MRRKHISGRGRRANFPRPVDPWDRLRRHQVKTDETKPNNTKKKKIGIIILLSIILIGSVILFFYLRYKATHISTDDAFIDGRIHTISAVGSSVVRIKCLAVASRHENSVTAVHISTMALIRSGCRPSAEKIMQF